MIYSCRAECSRDIDEVLAHARSESVDIVVRVNERFSVFDDRVVEFDSDLTVEQLRELMTGVTDTHIMRRTLRPCALAENSLEDDQE